MKKKSDLLARFDGPIVMIGFGSIGKGTLPLIERELLLNCTQSCCGATRAALVALSMHCRFALSGTVNCFLAWLAHGGEVLFDTHQYATCTGLYARALLPDILSAGFAHGSDLHECRLAWLGEILEMCLGTFGEATSFRSIGRTKFHNVPTASLNDRYVLAKSRRYIQQCGCDESPIDSTHASLQSFKEKAPTLPLLGPVQGMQRGLCTRDF